MKAVQSLMGAMQPLGRALMLPIAVLPIAGLLLRFGQPDMLDLAFVAAAGNAIFDHLGLLFAIGVGMGLARENHGAAGLAGAVAFIVLTEGAKTLLAVPPNISANAVSDPRLLSIIEGAWKDQAIKQLGVPAGICSGLIAGLCYNRFSNLKLPEYLAFFGGRRAVPIMAGLAGLLGAAIFGYGFPILQAGVDQLSHWVTESGSIGLFVYGALNRMLIVTGLHHVLNNIAWFVLGEFNGATGDLKRFFAGDPTAGAFMSGFFPVMMFGLPAACLAMYHAALPERRKEVGGMFLSLGLTSFLTGITEPIEFTFMFLAPVLYIIHIMLTGLAMVAMDWFGIRLGFSFSAGLLDYVLNYNLAARPLGLLLVGIVYSLLYYFLFRATIGWLNIKTPGREVISDSSNTDIVTRSGAAADTYIKGLGGASNLAAVEACTTRLRLRLRDMSLIDENLLKAAGAKGSIKVSSEDLQVVVGPIADILASEIRQIVGSTSAPLQEDCIKLDRPVDDDLAEVLGGDANIVSCRKISGRVLVEILDLGSVNGERLNILYPRRWAIGTNRCVHILK